MKKILIIISILFLFALIYCQRIWNIRPSIDQKVDDFKLTVVLTGFGTKNLIGETSGEIAPFHKHLDNASNLKNELNTCESAYLGNIYDQNVIVASSGMGKVRTASCLTQILENYDDQIEEVILVGIGGITPMRGGMLDENREHRDSDAVMIGDVCINSVSLDFEHQYFSSDTKGSIGENPVLWNGEVDKSISDKSSNGLLSEKLFGIASDINWPEAPEEVKNVSLLYHDEVRDTRVWGANECIEATSDLFWNDINFDQRAREIAAEILNQKGSRKITGSDVLILSSMEASAAEFVVNNWNEVNDSDIDFAYVRSASNFNHVYLDSDNLPAVSGKDVVESYESSDNSEYAIQNAALTVLKYLELKKAQ